MLANIRYKVTAIKIVTLQDGLVVVLQGVIPALEVSVDMQLKKCVHTVLVLQFWGRKNKMPNIFIGEQNPVRTGVHTDGHSCLSK